MTIAGNYLVDTGVFILNFRGDRNAIDFFRQTEATIYYSRVTRKELLRPPISARERQQVTACLQNYRLINPDAQIAEGFSGLLEQ
jgi:predicted nucleic acid-binding protein